MADLLVSFCNVFPRGLALGVYDFDGGRFRGVDLAGVGQPVTGVTGLTSLGGEYWRLAQLLPAGSSALRPPAEQ